MAAFISLYFSHRGSGSIKEQKVERMGELEDGEECCEILASGCDMADLLVKPHQIWLSTQDLVFMIKPAKIPM